MQIHAPKGISAEVTGRKQNIYSILLAIARATVVEWPMPVVKHVTNTH